MSDTWGSLSVRGGEGMGGRMMGTLQLWMRQWWFWVIVALAVMAFIFFIWAVSMTAQRDKLKKAADEKEKNGDKAAAFRRARARYMPDPGIPAKRLLHGDRSSLASGYTAGMSQDPDAVLKAAIRE